jgi:hypothetical protein
MSRKPQKKPRKRPRPPDLLANHCGHSPSK